MDFSFDSIAILPDVEAKAYFHTDSSAIFKEDGHIAPIVIDEHTSYIPWGANDSLPYDILEKIESDETLSTCQLFNAELCYGSGLRYLTDKCSAQVKEEVEDFLLDNNLAAYFLGVSQDFKHFGFCVTVLILNQERTKVVQILRKEAAYCRFTPADKDGCIPEVLYANWRRCVGAKDIEHIPLLNPTMPWRDLRERIARGKADAKFAILTKVPTPDSTYYPIPHYASIFKSKWYDIKQLIATAKKAKLEHSAPIKYHIEVSAKYWDSIFKQEGITDKTKMMKRVNEEKERIISFLTGAENAGKVWFSTFYISPDGKEQHDVVINKIDSSKEGGDWESDIQEAINIMCFTLRVHSNLVGSVPGKAQTNNSGSDKRELYTIAQALQKPYHDLLFIPHRILIRLNKWTGCEPDIPFVMLTTLDEHADAKTVTTKPNDNANQ